MHEKRLLYFAKEKLTRNQKKQHISIRSWNIFVAQIFAAADLISLCEGFFWFPWGWRFCRDHRHGGQYLLLSYIISSHNVTNYDASICKCQSNILQNAEETEFFRNCHFVLHLQYLSFLTEIFECCVVSIVRQFLFCIRVWISIYLCRNIHWVHR